MKRLVLSIVLAAVLWSVMFSRRRRMSTFG